MVFYRLLGSDSLLEFAKSISFYFRLSILKSDANWMPCFSIIGFVDFCFSWGVSIRQGILTACNSCFNFLKFSSVIWNLFLKAWKTACSKANSWPSLWHTRNIKNSWCFSPAKTCVLTWCSSLNLMCQKRYFFALSRFSSFFATCSFRKFTKFFYLGLVSSEHWNKIFTDL